MLHAPVTTHTAIGLTSEYTYPSTPREEVSTALLYGYPGEYAYVRSSSHDHLMMPHVLGRVACPGGQGEEAIVDFSGGIS